MKQATLCFLIQENQVLLAYKKRGYGKDKWNGMGGKIEPGETATEAAIRETVEEIGATPHDIKQVAIIDFLVEGKPKEDMKVYVFTCRKWLGEIIETEEMRPQWFDQNNLPFKQMWPDDEIWLPLILKGEEFVADFKFNQNEEIIEYHIKQ